VDDPDLMRRLNSRGDLQADIDRLVDWKRATRNPLRQRLPLDMFEGEIASAVALLQAIDGRDAWVAERGENLRLSLKRATRSGSAATSSGRALIAAVRFRRVSWAR
jgi:hypothetical protein